MLYNFSRKQNHSNKAVKLTILFRPPRTGLVLEPPEVRLLPSQYDLRKTVASMIRLLGVRTVQLVLLGKVVGLRFVAETKFLLLSFVDW